MENLDIDHTFWRNKRVFVTGHTGFKGSWLVRWLHLMGANVTGFALSPTSQLNLFELSKLASCMHSVIGNICDFEVLQEAERMAKPDIIFHLAAQSLVRYAYQHPIQTYQTNVMGTANILEVFRHSTTAKVVINITTDKCYENKEWHYAYREVDRLGGYDPYSSSKACSELITDAYRQSFMRPEQFEHHGKAIASARAGNVIGGGDWAQDRLVPDIIMTLSKSEQPILRFPNAVRPWQHVLEPLSGYILLAEKMWGDPVKYAGAWNFGPSDQDCQSVSQLTSMICQAWGGSASWCLSDENHPHEAKFLKLDISKAKAMLNWHPRWNLKQTVQHTVFWYQHCLQGADAALLMDEQIKSYEGRAVLAA